MFKWLAGLFGSPKVKSAPARSVPVAPKPKAEPAATRDGGGQDKAPLLEPEACQFLAGLLEGGEPRDLQAFSPMDRGFLSYIIKQVREGKVDIPVLPEAALKLQRLTANPDVQANDCVAVFKEDPSLSAELLKVANSAYYGFKEPTHDLTNAVVRVGFSQVRALVMLVNVRAKVLHGGHLQQEADWVTHLAMGTAKVCQELAAPLGVGRGEAFTLGLLNHVEFFVILGMATRYCSSNKEGKLTGPALAEAVRRLGPDLYKLVVKQWGLESMGLAGVAQGGGASLDEERIYSNREVIDNLAIELVQAWGGGEPDYRVAELDHAAVEKAIASVS